MSDPRMVAVVQLAEAVTSGDDLPGLAAEHFSFMNSRLGQRATPAPVIDWSPEGIALIQEVTTAYVRTALNLEDEAWSQVGAGLADDSPALGRLESK